MSSFIKASITAVLFIGISTPTIHADHRSDLRSRCNPILRTTKEFEAFALAMGLPRCQQRVISDFSCAMRNFVDSVNCQVPMGVVLSNYRAVNCLYDEINQFSDSGRCFRRDRATRRRYRDLCRGMSDIHAFVSKIGVAYPPIDRGFHAGRHNDIVPRTNHRFHGGVSDARDFRAPAPPVYSNRNRNANSEALAFILRELLK